MILPAGIARALAPFEGALAAMAEGAVFDAVVQARTGEGRYRVSIAGVPVDIETTLEFGVRERLRVTVATRDPLTLEVTRQAAPRPEAAAAGRAALPAELEAAVRAFGASRPAESGVREAAARWIADRGLGFDPRPAAGLASLAARPGGAAALLERASRALLQAGPAGVAADRALRAALPEAVGTPDLIAVLGRALRAGAGQGPAEAARVLFAAADGVLADPAFAPLDGNDAAAARESARRHPLAGPLTETLGAARELADRAVAARLVGAEAVVRGEAAGLFEIAWIAAGRFESALIRVTSDPGASPGDPGADAVDLVVTLSRLGSVRAAVALRGAAASVSLVAASPPARRALERGRHALVEALLRLGLRADVRVSEGPADPLLDLGRPGVDLTG